MPHLIAALRSRFELSEGRQIYYLLGMHITCDHEKRTISFSQSAYINCILTRYRFDEIRTVTTPMDPNVALSKEQCATSERQLRRDEEQAVQRSTWRAHVRLCWNKTGHYLYSVQLGKILSEPRSYALDCTQTHVRISPWYAALHSYTRWK